MKKTHYVIVTDLEQEVVLGNVLKKTIFISTIWIYTFLYFYVTLSGIGPYHLHTGIDDTPRGELYPHAHQADTVSAPRLWFYSHCDSCLPN